MEVYLLYYGLAIAGLLASFLPYIPKPHWIFRACAFLRLQVLVLLAVLGCMGFFIPLSRTATFMFTQLLIGAGMVNHLIKLAPYLPFKTWMGKSWRVSPHSVSLLSVNVYQFNTQYHRLLELVERTSPDVLLTVETNQAWEDALKVLDNAYPFQQKVAQENTYGMHFYSKLPVDSCQVLYLMAPDLPSVQVEMQDKLGQKFQLFGIHPPPPSPTEETTSKERDGELLAVGKRVRNSELPTLVVGDFNNVAWSRSTRLFRKLSGLRDPRVGRGLFSTYPARWPLFRFPIDLLYHSAHIEVQHLNVLENIGSDHFPLFCRFFIDRQDKLPPKEALEKDEKQEAREMIREGKQEKGNRSPK